MGDGQRLVTSSATMGADENMDSNLEQERQQAHAYLDLLPHEKLSAILGLLQIMLSPARSIANIPIEDEEIGAYEERDVADAREWFKTNKGVPHEEVLAEFGLTPADFERMSRTPLPAESNGVDR